MSPLQPEAPDVSQVALVEVAALAAFIDAGVPIWDVRTAEEWAEGHLQAATWVPMDSLPQAAQSSLETQQPVVLYCRSGNRALKSGKLLADAGYTRVHVLRPGGYAQLKEAGYAVAASAH